MTDTALHKRPVLVVTLLSMLSILSYALRSNIAVAQEQMMPELGLTTQDMGTISAWGYQLAYALFQIPAGFLGDRYGTRPILALAVLGWAASTFATGAVPAAAGVGATFAALFAARFALGVTQAATYPVGALAITQVISPARRGTANSIFISAAVLGSAITPPLISWAMVHLGWRTSFNLGAALGLVGALAWYLFTPLRHTATRETTPLGVQLREAFGLLRNRSILLLSISYAAQAAVFFVFVFWFFRYLTDARGFSILKSGVFGALPYVVAAIIAPFGGILTDVLSARWSRRQGRRAVAMGGLLLAALCVALGASANDPYLAIAALSVSVGCLNSVEGPFWTTVTALGGTRAGAAGGVLNFMGNMGGVISIWAVPRMVAAWGWTATLATWAGVAVAGALLWLTFTAARPDEA
jgi:ACS family glucarate transporter-like MFS transporter